MKARNQVGQTNASAVPIHYVSATYVQEFIDFLKSHADAILYQFGTDKSKDSHCCAINLNEMTKALLKVSKRILGLDLEFSSLVNPPVVHPYTQLFIDSLALRSASFFQHYEVRESTDPSSMATDLYKVTEAVINICDQIINLSFKHLNLLNDDVHTRL